MITTRGSTMLALQKSLTQRRKERKEKQELFFCLSFALFAPLREVFFYLSHQLAEFFTQIDAIMRAGGGFRVILHTEERPALVTQALEGLIVEVDVRRFEIGRQRVEPYREAVVLRRDLDLVGALIQDRLIGATMAD